MGGGPSEFFRSMTPARDGLPEEGRSARKLGVRVPDDIEPDGNGNVSGGTGGLSVAPASMWNLPHHRRPRGMKRGSTGKDTDRVYSLGGAALDGSVLVIRPDPKAPALHAFVEPCEMMSLAKYESGLSATRPHWRQAWQ